MDAALVEIKTALQSLKSRYKFVDLRSRFISEPSEKVFHEINLLKAEKDLLMLMRKNLAVVATSPDPELRLMLENFKHGQVTGLVLNKELSWEGLDAYVDSLIEKLELKYERLEAKQNELKELMQE